MYALHVHMDLHVVKFVASCVTANKRFHSLADPKKLYSINFTGLIVKGRPHFNSLGNS